MIRFAFLKYSAARECWGDQLTPGSQWFTQQRFIFPHAPVPLRDGRGLWTTNSLRVQANGCSAIGASWDRLPPQLGQKGDRKWYVWPRLSSSTPLRSDSVGCSVALRSCKGAGECLGVRGMLVSGDRHPFCFLGSQSEPLRYVRGDGGLGSGGVGICLTGRPNKICRRHGRLLNFSPSRSLISYTNCDFFEPGSCFYLIFP